MAKIDNKSRKKLFLKELKSLFIIGLSAFFFLRQDNVIGKESQQKIYNFYKKS